VSSEYISPAGERIYIALYYGPWVKSNMATVAVMSSVFEEVVCRVTQIGSNLASSQNRIRICTPMAS